VVAASSRGSSGHPDWYLNLVRDPKVWVRRDADLFPATAVAIEEPDRDRLWGTVVLTKAPRFAEYQAMTERTIPLVRLVEDR
jgi:deazaflavin-dependent oxidoreductase (nitroreductase family)